MAKEGMRQFRCSRRLRRDQTGRYLFYAAVSASVEEMAALAVGDNKRANDASRLLTAFVDLLTLAHPEGPGNGLAWEAAVAQARREARVQSSGTSTRQEPIPRSRT